MNLTFAGCGFLGMYHIGVVSAIQEHAPKMMDSIMNFGGCSAGAIAAAAASTGCNMAGCASRVLQMARYTRNLLPFNLGQFFAPLHPRFDITHIIRTGLNEILPKNAHDLASGRLHISLSKLTFTIYGKPVLSNIIVSEFKSKEELIEVMTYQIWLSIRYIYIYIYISEM